MVVYLLPKLYKETITNLSCKSYESYFHQNSVQMLEIYIFLTIFSCAKKTEDNENLGGSGRSDFIGTAEKQDPVKTILLEELLRIPLQSMEQDIPGFPCPCMIRS